jgi:hypothetical protein
MQGNFQIINLLKYSFGHKFLHFTINVNTIEAVSFETFITSFENSRI